MDFEVLIDDTLLNIVPECELDPMGGAGVIGYTTLIEPHWLQLVTHDLTIANLPPGLHGAKLAHVSDIHVCSYVNERYLTESLRRLDPFAPDIVVFTGDFVSWEPDRPDNVKIAQLRRVLSNLPHDGLATVGILGALHVRPEITVFTLKPEEAPGGSPT